MRGFFVNVRAPSASQAGQSESRAWTVFPLEEDPLFTPFRLFPDPNLGTREHPLGGRTSGRYCVRPIKVAALTRGLKSRVEPIRKMLAVGKTSWDYDIDIAKLETA